MEPYGALRIVDGLRCVVVGELERVSAREPEATRLRAEVAFTRRFADAAPLAMPRYQELRQEGDTVTATRRVPAGRLDCSAPPPPPESFARVIAWLATLTVDDVLDAGVLPRTTSVQNTARLYREAATIFSALAPRDAELARLGGAFFTAARVLRPRRDPARVVHGRLGRDVTWRDDQGGVSGVGGWGHVGFGDPAASLFRLHQWGGPAYVAAVVQAAALPLDDELLARVAFLSRCAALFDLRAALHTSDLERAGWARAALRWT